MIRGKTYLSVATVVLFIALAGCATGGYYYSGSVDKSEATKAYEQAKSLYEQKNYAEAQKKFQELISNHPHSPLAEVAMYYLGDCYKEQKDYEKSISTYQDLVDKYYPSFWAESAKEEIGEIKSSRKK